jgi:ubiquinone/menaquinone biosynthesis C-methylase UbiE
LSAVAGNVYDKYATRNPLARALVTRFRRTLDELIDSAAPSYLLDVGCGEGVLTAAWAGRVERTVGVDVDDARLRAEWARREAPGLEFGTVDPAVALPFADGEFDLVAAVEVLEHAADPGALLGELARCARRHVLVSVPREPLWRALNLARGAYWRELGNTPGHRHHFSRGALRRLACAHGTVLATRSPLPWIVLLLEPGRLGQSAPAAAAISR